MITLGIALIALGIAQGLDFLTDGDDITMLLAVVVVLAFIAGVCYAFVAVPAQTSLQEELPSDVRGRVFGVLNMLVSLASFLPIIRKFASAAGVSVGTKDISLAGRILATFPENLTDAQRITDDLAALAETIRARIAE